MRDNDHLTLPGRLHDQLCQRRQQIGMQAGFRFVEDHQRGRPWRQQGRDQLQVAQRTVGQFGGQQRPQQPVLSHPNLEIGAGVGNRDAATRERIGDRIVHRLAVDPVG
jgi:hypothetical protein